VRIPVIIIKLSAARGNSPLVLSTDEENVSSDDRKPSVLPLQFLEMNAAELQKCDNQEWETGENIVTALTI